MKNRALGYAVGIACGVAMGFWWTASPAWAAPAVVISQVQITGGSGHTTDDFVELFNPNSEPFNLKGYRLVKRTSAGQTDTTLKSWAGDAFIPAYGFYLWANSDFSGIAATPDATTTGSLADSNGVALRQGSEDAGVLVDGVAWGTAQNGFPVATAENPGAGQALFRQDLYAPSSGYAVGSASPRNSSVTDPAAPAPAAGQTATTTTSTPPSAQPEASSTSETVTATPQAPQAPQAGGGTLPLTKSSAVRITEILPNPKGEDSGQEAVELKNTGTEAVNLEGWYLQDKTDSGPKTSAYRFPWAVLGPGQLTVVTLPKGVFSLNNTGGDQVNLYFADKTLSQTVAYPGDADEGVSYQEFSGSWVWSEASLGRENFVGTASAVQNAEVDILEVCPNPDGSDEGREWVVLVNRSAEPVNLKGFWLDDEGSGSVLGSSAWQLSEQAAIPAGGQLKLTIPEDAFTLNNTGDTVRLFSPAKKLLSSVPYKDAPDGGILSKGTAGAWTFASNGTVLGTSTPAALPFVVSELLPNPAGDDREFLELQNTGVITADLYGLTVKVGKYERTLKTHRSVGAGDFAVLWEDDLPGRLTDAGNTVSLLGPGANVLSFVSYPEAEDGWVYALSGGTYAWTAEPTPGQPNVITAGSQVPGGEDTETKSAGGSTKKGGSATVSAARLLSEMRKLNRELSDKVGRLEEAVGRLTENLSSGAGAQAQAEVAAQQPTAEPSERKGVYLGVSGAALLLLAGLAKRFFV